MVNCFIPECRHFSDKYSCRFFSFPTSIVERLKWIKSIGKTKKEPTIYSRICSCHFKDGERSNGPTIFGEAAVKIGKAFEKSAESCMGQSASAVEAVKLEPCHIQVLSDEETKPQRLSKERPSKRKIKHTELISKLSKSKDVIEIDDDEDDDDKEPVKILTTKIKGKKIELSCALCQSKILYDIDKFDENAKQNSLSIICDCLQKVYTKPKPKRNEATGTRSSHCPAVRTGPALGCNYCWNTVDNHGRILRRKTKYHCPECQTNLCIVPCFQEYHERHVSTGQTDPIALTTSVMRVFPKTTSM